MAQATATNSTLRRKFFEFLFEDQTGYLCIAYADRNPNPQVMRRTFRETWFNWPNERKELTQFLDRQVTKNHLWYGVHLFSRKQRKRDYALPGNVVYADLDACSPKMVEPSPSVIIESSPGRFQALWRLTEKVEPHIQAEFSRRIAYKYAINGVDKSGWDIEQVLRVPYTRNFKYDGSPEVGVVETHTELLSPDEFSDIEIPVHAPNIDLVVDETMPKIEELPKPEAVFYKYEQHLRGQPVAQLFYNEPDFDADWSAIMWRLINICIEAGMEETEVFAIAFHAKCNKYQRDNRPIRFLWREVLKATEAQNKLKTVLHDLGPLSMPELAREPATENFVNSYVLWATESTDAVPEFHELAAFVALSATLASTARLEVTYAYGEAAMVPNLWGMCLGESTLTRKTTAMRLAMDIVQEIDDSAILATDSSVEGLLSGLEGRPAQASIFFRDEVSGFFASLNKKDYLAGMSEVLTQLYDVPAVFHRLLRKQAIHIQSPILIFFCGGIRDRVFSMLDDEYILSGFIPRFLVVSGDTDLSRIRSTGPPTMINEAGRAKLVSTLADAYEIYNTTASVRIGSQTAQSVPKSYGELTPEAWERYQQIEQAMTHRAIESPIPHLALPTFERLARSLLKMSLLLAAVRQEPQGHKFTVSLDDVQNAAYYIERWGKHSIELIYNCGVTKDVRLLRKIRRAIERTPGVDRSTIMRHHHLTKRQMDDAIGSLVDRGEIRRQKSGRMEVYWAL